jgi:hypothetical protein
MLFAQQACAGVALLQPAKQYDASKPLVLTLLFGDDASGDQYQIPDTLKVSASADMTAPAQLVLQRIDAGSSTIRLAQGEYRKVSYAGTLPPSLRGSVRIEPVDYDAAAILVTLVRPNPALGALPQSNDNDSAAPAIVGNDPPVAAPPGAVDLLNASRISLSATAAAMSAPNSSSVSNTGYFNRTIRAHAA